MKLNINYQLKNLNGSLILDQGEPVTLKTVVVSGLIEPSDESPSEKQKKFMLAQKIYNAQAPIDISLDEAKQLIDCLPKHLSPIVVGQCVSVIEGNEPVFPSDFQEVELSQE